MRDLGPGRRVGRFVIERKLGQGGMGAVFAATDERGERLALKLIAGDSSEWTRRFEREARAALAVRHENVARVLPLEVHEGLLVLPMELLEGGTLRDEVKKRGPLPWREAAARGAAIARGLAAIHAGGFVHRDLKPANVLLDAEGRLKITDFGLVRRAQDASAASGVLTTTGEILGTFEYLAPELAEGTAVDARTDLYALGATLYELLSGAPPFAGAGYMLVARHLRDTPASLAPRGVPKALDTLVQSLLAKRQSDRPANAAEVADELDAMLSGKPRAVRRPRALRAAVGILLAGAGAALLAFALHRVRGETPPPPAVAPDPVPKPPSTFEGRYREASAACPLGALDLARGHDEPRHRTAVRMVAFFHDREHALRLVSGGPDGLRVWDPATGREDGPLFPVPEGVRSISVADDERTIAVGTFWRRAFVFDLWERRPREGYTHTEGQVAVAISPDGKRVLSSAGATKPALWAVRDGAVEKELDHERLRAIWFLRFARDGKSVIAGQHGGRVLRIDLASWEIDELARHEGAATEGAVLSNGTVLSVGPDRDLLVVRPSGPPGHIKVHDDAPGVYAVAATPDEKLAVTGGRDGTVEIHDLARPDDPPLHRFQAHATDVNSVAVTGSLIATGSEDGTVRFFDIEGRERVFQERATTHRGAILSVALSPDAKTLLTTSEDATAKLWTSETATVTATRRFESPVLGAAFIDDRRGSSPLVVSLERRHGLKLWRTGGSKILAETLAGSGPSGASGFAFGGTDQRVIVSNGTEEPAVSFNIKGDSDSAFSFFSTLREHIAELPPDGVEPPVTSYQAAVTAVDSFVLAGTPITGNRIFVRGSPHPLVLDAFGGENDRLVTVAFLDAKGTRAITGTAGGIVSLWNLGSRTREWTYSASPGMKCVAALDERRVLVLSGTRLLALDAEPTADRRLLATLDLEKADDRPTCVLVDLPRKKLWLGTAKGALLRIALK